MEHQTRQLQRLLRAVEIIRTLDPSIPIQTFSAFLIIALQEGRPVHEIGQKIGLAQSSASRNISALSAWTWRKREGLGLVEYRIDPMNLSVKVVSLTARGKRLAESLANTLEERGTV